MSNDYKIKSEHGSININDKVMQGRFENLLTRLIKMTGIMFRKGHVNHSIESNIEEIKDRENDKKVVGHKISFEIILSTDKEVIQIYRSEKQYSQHMDELKRSGNRKPFFNMVIRKLTGLGTGFRSPGIQPDKSSEQQRNANGYASPSGYGGSRNLEGSSGEMVH